MLEIDQYATSFTCLWGFRGGYKGWVPCCLTERLEYLILITDYDGICLRVGLFERVNQKG